MFGRMLANATKYNVEAAVQVAHAITVHEVAVEDDYFTAVDDLNKGDDDAGAAHLGETEFASGLFYTYICIDKTLLQENLDGDAVPANTAIKAFVEAATKVAPTVAELVCFTGICLVPPRGKGNATAPLLIGCVSWGSPEFKRSSWCCYHIPE